ncbi:MAG TPA: methionine--tRNA ligase subunit beta [Candidatus Omnitrophota bacterium]|nr:methionine--tRNA ligase subunit beta [Candidatus Omnitrophota bacterium]
MKTGTRSWSHGHAVFLSERDFKKENFMITIEDFKKIELIIAQVKEVKEHPNADRLYVLKVDTGSGERQLVAGIRSSYKPEDLIGRRVVLVANLEPAVIRGEESQGMVLAASDETGISVLMPDKDVALGSRVK